MGNSRYSKLSDPIIKSFIEDYMNVMTQGKYNSDGYLNFLRNELAKEYFYNSNSFVMNMRLFYLAHSK